MTSPQRRAVAAAAVALAVFFVYAAGACPTIFVGDSGELVTAVHVLGIPHPTGYPLYVLLGKAGVPDCDSGRAQNAAVVIQKQHLVSAGLRVRRNREQT